MARMKKGSRKITVRNVAYRWLVSGNDGFIAVSIWPDGDAGATIETSFSYDETLTPSVTSDGTKCWKSNGDQVVITNRVVKRVIEYAISHHAYDPLVRAPVLNLRGIDSVIDMSDVVRGNRTPP